MKRLGPFLFAWVPALLGGCLLPQPDTPGVPPSVFANGRTTAAGGAILPQPDTPGVPAGVAAPTAAADAGAGLSAPTMAPEGATNMAQPGVAAQPNQPPFAASLLPPPQPLPKALPLVLGSVLGAEDLATLWPQWRAGQSWRYQQQPSGTTWLLIVRDPVAPSFEWREEFGATGPVRPLAERGIPTAPEGSASGAFRVTGVEDLAWAGGSYGPCLLVERRELVEGMPYRLRAWIAPGLGVLRQVWGPEAGGPMDQSWQLLGEVLPEATASPEATPESGDGASGGVGAPPKPRP